MYELCSNVYAVYLVRCTYMCFSVRFNSSSDIRLMLSMVMCSLWVYY